MHCLADPDAEVVALSPRTLLATNRFVCEICGKGFQRDQNLQLHRRGHNLPWKLRQRSGKAEPRKRVYVCPEKSCVHHNPEKRARRPHRNQEALLPEARREEVEVRQVQQALRRAVGLEGALQDLRHQGVQMRLRHALLEVLHY